MRTLVLCLMFGAASLAKGGEPALIARTEVKTGQKLYELKCAKCHKFYDPAQYSDQEWEMWMKKMGKKSHLKGEQLRLVSEYAEVLRKKPRSN